MSLVELRHTHQSEAVTGGNMDRVVARKRIDRRVLIAGGAAAVLLIVLIFWLFAPRAGTQTVSRDRLTIATVERGELWTCTKSAFFLRRMRIRATASARFSKGYFAIVRQRLSVPVQAVPCRFTRTHRG